MSNCVEETVIPVGVQGDAGHTHGVLGIIILAIEFTFFSPQFYLCIDRPIGAFVVLSKLLRIYVWDVWSPVKELCRPDEYANRSLSRPPKSQGQEERLLPLHTPELVQLDQSHVSQDSVVQWSLDDLRLVLREESDVLISSRLIG